MTPVSFPKELIFPPPHEVMAQSMAPAFRQAPETPAGMAAMSQPLDLKPLPGQAKEVAHVPESPSYYIVYRVAPGFSSISISYEPRTTGDFLNSRA